MDNNLIKIRKAKKEDMERIFNEQREKCGVDKNVRKSVHSIIL